MTRYINLQEVEKKIDLQDGSILVLLDRLAKESIYGRLECAKNIFLIDLSGAVIWQIETDFDVDGGTFTNIFVENAQIKGYRWDGGAYLIDIRNGRATPLSLLK